MLRTHADSLGVDSQSALLAAIQNPSLIKLRYHPLSYHQTNEPVCSRYYILFIPCRKVEHTEGDKKAPGLVDVDDNSNVLNVIARAIISRRAALKDDDNDEESDNELWD